MKDMERKGKTDKAGSSSEVRSKEHKETEEKESGTEKTASNDAQKNAASATDPNRTTGKNSAGMKFRGARLSTVNPKVETLRQHEANKMRIFKLFLLLFAISAILLSAYYLYTRFRTLSDDRAYFNEHFAALSEIDRELETDSGDMDTYSKEKKIADGIRSAELLLARFPSEAPRLKKRLTAWRDWLEKVKPHLNPPGTRGTNFICPSALIDMVHIPDGSFLMGSDENDNFASSDESPRRVISIGTQFWIARTEIDIYQIRKLIPSFRMRQWGEYRLDSPDSPAGSVTWDQAMLYCKKLTELERAAGRIPDGFEYRLPTEAEWEYACRAGTETRFFWGDEFGETGARHANGLDARAADQFGWKLLKRLNPASSDAHLVSAPCGSYQPNHWGLYDMSGNLSEWCYDWYDPKAYSDKVTPRKSPVRLHPVTVVYSKKRNFDAGSWETETACRVIRGGSWGVLPDKMRSASRDFMPANEVNIGVGFRPVLAPIIPNKISN